ncbi:hypothetical protein N7499_009140 [Penicillium canescens]|nr:hypothetical protein N7499_009140 [Penicillium canescens]KAJ6169809.1 hypothetical protein N7485_007155 [Penicillium canescens]
MKSSDIHFFVNASESPVFKTHDTIDGEILFTPHQQTDIDDINISFQGNARTEVENMNTHVPLPYNELRKTFLRMDIAPLDYLLDTNTLSSGKTYRIPFKFVVPDQLPIHACHHQCSNPQIHQEHLHLPASLSYQTHKPNGHDMSPEMAEIIYSINFVLWQRGGKAGRSKKLQEAIYPVQIQPTREEHAPIFVPAKNTYYKLQSQKTVTKGLLRHTIGQLEVSSAQPPAIQLHSPQPHNDVSTTLKIDLRFQPTRTSQAPPSLLAAQFQLRAMTFFGLEPWRDSPDLSDISTWGPRQAFWSEHVALTADRDINVDWKSHSEKGHAVFTASIQVPVSLPCHRRYPTTFHSCLVSRVYAVKVNLFYRAHEKARGTSSISLSVPVEICA